MKAEGEEVSALSRAEASSSAWVTAVKKDFKNNTFIRSVMFVLVAMSLVGLRNAFMAQSSTSLGAFHEQAVQGQHDGTYISSARELELTEALAAASSAAAAATKAAEEAQKQLQKQSQEQEAHARAMTAALSDARTQAASSSSASGQYTSVGAPASVGTGVHAGSHDSTSTIWPPVSLKTQPNSEPALGAGKEEGVGKPEKEMSTLEKEKIIQEVAAARRAVEEQQREAARAEEMEEKEEEEEKAKHSNVVAAEIAKFDQWWKSGNKKPDESKSSTSKVVPRRERASSSSSSSNSSNSLNSGGWSSAVSSSTSTPQTITASEGSIIIPPDAPAVAVAPIIGTPSESTSSSSTAAADAPEKQPRDSISTAVVSVATPPPSSHAFSPSSKPVPVQHAPPAAMTSPKEVDQASSLPSSSSSSSSLPITSVVYAPRWCINNNNNANDNSWSSTRANRVLVYGMQGSGASIVAYLLAQAPNTILLASLQAGRAAPAPSDLKLTVPEGEQEVPSVVLQAFVNNRQNLTSLVKKFKPHFTVLVTRHPAAGLASLSSRGAVVATRAGSIEDKAKSLELLFASLLISQPLRHSSSSSSSSSSSIGGSIRISNGGSSVDLEVDDASTMVDAVISWEELLTNHSLTAHKLECLGYAPSLIDTLYAFPRQAELLVDFTVRHCKWAKEHRGHLWEFPTKRFGPPLHPLLPPSTSGGSNASASSSRHAWQSQWHLPPPSGGPRKFALDSNRVLAAPLNEKWFEKAQQWCPTLLSHYQAVYPALTQQATVISTKHQQKPADGKTISTNQQRPSGDGKRILVYGLQSSGAALVAYALAQRPGAVAILDLKSGKKLPTSDDTKLKASATDVIIKMTVSTPGGDNEDGAGGVTEAGAHVLSELKSALDLFQPHLCVLVLRHPAVNFASLHSKTSRDLGGKLEDKAAALEAVFTQSFFTGSASSLGRGQRRLFDEVVLYEDLALGIDSLATHSPPLVNAKQGGNSQSKSDKPTATNHAAATAEEWAQGHRRTLLIEEESSGTTDSAHQTANGQTQSETDRTGLSHPSLRRLWQRLLVDPAEVASPSSSASSPSSLKLEQVNAWLRFPRTYEELSSWTLNQCGWCSATHKKSWGSASTKLATLKFEHLASTKTFSVPGGGPISLKGHGKTAGDVAGANDPRWAGVVKGVHRKVSKQLFGSASALMPAQFQFYNQLKAHASLNDQSLGKRIMVFGLPRSGASLFSFLLAQRPSAVTMPRVYQGAPVPRSNDLKLGRASVGSIIDRTSSSSSGSVGNGHERHSKSDTFSNARRTLMSSSPSSESAPENEMRIRRGQQKGSALAVSAALMRAVDPSNGQLKALAFDAIDVVICVPLFQDKLFEKEISATSPVKTTSSSGSTLGSTLRRKLLGINGTIRVGSGQKSGSSNGNGNPVGGSIVRAGMMNGTSAHSGGQSNKGKISSSSSSSGNGSGSKIGRHSSSSHAGCQASNSSGLCAHVAWVRAAIAAFQPDVSFSVLRHPARHHGSLCPQASTSPGDQFLKAKASAQLSVAELAHTTHMQTPLFTEVVLYEDLVLNHDKIGTQLRGAGLGDVDPRKLFRFDRTPHDVLEYTLQHSGWAKDHYEKSWDAQLPYYRTGPPSKTTTTSGASGAGGGMNGKNAPKDSSSGSSDGAATGLAESNSIMLRVDILKEALPPSQLDFEVASATSPTLVQLFEERFPELSRGRGRRFLVYSLQASGGTIFTHLLSQLGGSVGILDLWAAKSVPTAAELGVAPTTDVFFKTVASNKFKIPQIFETFQPHVKILFLRHPAHALSNLRRREASGLHKLGTGTADAKLRMMEDAYVNQLAYGFDANVTYEELTFAPGRGQPGSPLYEKLITLGFTVAQVNAMYKFSRSADEIRSHAMKSCLWCKRSAGSSWELSATKRARMGVGFELSDAHVEQFPTQQEHTKAMLASPMLYGWYKQHWPSLCARSGKRVFVYGMQSSGASTFLYLLAQLAKSVGIIDLYVGRPAPTPEGFDLSVSPYVFLKGTVNTNYTVDQYIEAFQPDIKLLFVRHPEHNLASLKKKFYAGVAGNLDDKFKALEDAYKRREKLFDEVILYEEMVLNRPVLAQKLQGVGFSRDEVATMFEFKRSLKDITAFSRHASVWCRQYHMAYWDVGNFHGASTADTLLNPDYLDRKPSLEDRARAYKDAPSLTAWFRSRFPELSPGKSMGAGSSSSSSTALVSPSSGSSSSGNGTEECDPRGGGCDGSVVGWETVAGSGSSQDDWKSLVENLMVMVRARAKSNRIVFVMASENWIDVLLNWVCRLEHIGFTNYIIFAADDPLYEKLVKIKAPVFHFRIKGTQVGHLFHQQLWLNRWRLMSEVVKHGFDVLHSDADAVWIGDPSAILNLQVDIIASRGSPEPDWLLCMGYVYIRSTPSTLEFLPRFIKRLIDVKDDQRAFNLVLKYGLHLTWNKNPFLRSAFREVIVGSVLKPPMQVVLLPNNIARRFGCEPGAMSGSEIVVHCRQVGNVAMTQNQSPDTKSDGLAKLGLWVLKNGWEDVPTPPLSWSSHLDAICARPRL